VEAHLQTVGVSGVAVIIPSSAVNCRNLNSSFKFDLYIFRNLSIFEHNESSLPGDIADVSVVLKVSTLDSEEDFSKALKGSIPLALRVKNLNFASLGAKFKN
jgi:hypothetical protein